MLRGVVVVAALVAGVSCTTGSGEPGRAAPRSSSSTTTEAPRLAPPERYVPLPGEPGPEVKQLASDVLQSIGTYEIGGGTAAAAMERLAGRGSSAVVDAAAPLLLPAAASAVEIVYPQLAGLTEADAAIMVVFRHRVLVAGEEEVAMRTADVRLVRGSAGWSVSTIASLGGNPVSVGTLSPSAQAALNSDRLELPDSARWDIEAGRIDDRLLDLLTRIAVDHSLSVTVLATGHPYNVFGTKLVSNHSVGRAVDVWAVDGVPVVSQRDPAGPLQALVAQLLADGVTELGSPWDLDGPGNGSSFTNTVHQDHLHLAFDA